MREMGFSKKWPKLQQPVFTTFRFPRKDKDWSKGETVKIVYHPRHKDREVLGMATIILKEPRQIGGIPNSEAIEDGFPGGWEEMINWMNKTYGHIDINRSINKLTLRRQNE